MERARLVSPPPPGPPPPWRPPPPGSVLRGERPPPPGSVLRGERAPPPGLVLSEAERYDRWRGLALRWWQAQHASPRHTQILFYTPEELRDMMQVGRLVRGARLRLPAAADWRLDARDPQLPQVAEMGAGGGRGGRGAAWGGGGAGAVLLMVLLAMLLVRLGEKCVARLLRARRARRHWNVPALSGHCTEDVDAEGFLPSLDDPPPYAQVAANAGDRATNASPGAANASPKPEPDEPPPPYSECRSLKGSSSESPVWEVPRVEYFPRVEDIPRVEDVPRMDDVPRVEDAPRVEDIPRVEDVPTLEDAPNVGTEGSSALCDCCECEALRQEEAEETCVCV